MGVVDPIAMTNGMATGGVGYPGALALWLMLLGLLVGSAAGVVFAGLPHWRPRSWRLPRLTPAGRPGRLAGAAK
jgi:hypothetical protein